MEFDLNPLQRKETWEFVTRELENYYSNAESYRAGTYPERKEVIESLESNFDNPMETRDAITEVLKGMSKYAVHTPHPGYYGMFNPRANFPSIIADTITATYNPQLAAWGHAPFAAEVENLLVKSIGQKFGYKSEKIDGVFTSGGQEANLSAVLAALNHIFPNFAKTGVQAIKGKPVIYCSKVSHHATVKAARVSGLGSDSIRYIEVNADQEMDVMALKNSLDQDRQAGHRPFMIVATMGTTGAGAIDPIKELAGLAKKYSLWLHADAAYGGAIVLTEKYKHLMDGIELADSITFDAHKWLSVPMAAGMFITRHRDILGRAFSIKSDYMPEEEDETEKLSSYTHSIQWSRRFIGLKLYLPLLVFGWKGYEKTIMHQIKVGQLLKAKLLENNWILQNHTELPIACFTDPQIEEQEEFANYIYESFLETGEAWINKYPIEENFTLRACITNYATEEKHLDQLIGLLNKKREEFLSRKDGSRKSANTITK